VRWGRTWGHVNRGEHSVALNERCPRNKNPCKALARFRGFCLLSVFSERSILVGQPAHEFLPPLARVSVSVTIGGSVTETVQSTPSYHLCAAIRLYRVANYRPCGERSTPSCFGVFGPVAASWGGSLNGTSLPLASTNTTSIRSMPCGCGGGSVAAIFGCKYGAAVRAISSRRVFDAFGSRMMRSIELAAIR